MSVEEWTKANILQVGTVDDQGQPQNWMFDCMGVVPAINVQADGVILHAGYTVDELRSIARGAAAPTASPLRLVTPQVIHRKPDSPPVILDAAQRGSVECVGCGTVWHDAGSEHHYDWCPVPETHGK